MKDFSLLGVQQAKRVKYVLHDIDDTITDEGKLLSIAYDALWRLHEAGIKVIPVTGRPAGWCDMMIRQWPIDCIIGENGAFVYYFEDGLRKTFTHPLAATDVRSKLACVRDACLSNVPGCRVAKDQFSRIYDLAIDFNEDEPRLGFEAAEKIKNICTSMGAMAKISSIHVNAWFGDYDKLSMTELFFSQVLKETALKQTILFFGDSPNDEPMFAYFPLSCGVANIRAFGNTIVHFPTFVTKQQAGRGFAEAVDQLLKLLSAS